MNNIEKLEELYKERQVYYGDLHNHSSSGGTSDGQRTLAEWKIGLKALDMDFAAILDHRQVRHMYLPDWDDSIFISGTEPGTAITDIGAKNPGMHYNMIFESSARLEDLLSEFEEYKFEGGQEGHFIYPRFTRERFCELIDAVKARGGFFVHPHPKQVMVSDDPLDYWYRDETGIEVFYSDMRCDYTVANYRLWTDLLALGKRVWACAGEDGHLNPRDTALTSIYSEECNGASFLPHLRQGDFVCGSVGIRMCIGDTKMGGQCRFDGAPLTVAVGDFHKSVKKADHKYRMDVITDNGVVYSKEIPCDATTYAVIDTENCDFYRVEVFDETEDLRIAIGNPIWNIK